MERRMFLFSGLAGLLPFGRRRKRRDRRQSTEVDSVSHEPVTIQYETRDKIGNAEELFANSEWRPKTGPSPDAGQKRVAYAYLPRDRAFTYYIAGVPKIWWGACVVIQYRYSDPDFLSAISVYAIPASVEENFPAGEPGDISQTQKCPNHVMSDEVIAKQTEACAEVAGKSGMRPVHPVRYNEKRIEVFWN